MPIEPPEKPPAPAMLPGASRVLTPEEFSALAEVPPETEWLANITNEKTKRAYRADVAEFMAFARLKRTTELRTVARAHVIAWRKTMEARELADATIRRKLSAISSLFEYLCERNAIAGNPVDGVKRPMSNSNEGSTPALGDEQAKRLLMAPPPDTLKGVRDSAILATLLYHGIRREELCKLRVVDMQTREGVVHFRVEGKRDKIRFVPVHPTAQRLIAVYLKMIKHGEEVDEHPANRAIILEGVGAQLRIYCRYGLKAVEEGEEIDSLTWNPTAGDWKMHVPCDEENLEWVKKSLAVSSPRIKVFNVADAERAEEEETSTSTNGNVIEVDWNIRGSFDS